MLHLFGAVGMIEPLKAGGLGMETWICENCGLVYDSYQPLDRCALCGMRLRKRFQCDGCGASLGRYIVTDTGRQLCEHYLPDVLAESIAILGGTLYA